MDRADHRVGHMRLELAHLRAVQHRVIDAILIEKLRLGDCLAQALLGAQASEPASLVNEACRRAAGLGDEGVVLLDALFAA